MLMSTYTAGLIVALLIGMASSWFYCATLIKVNINIAIFVKQVIVERYSMLISPRDLARNTFCTTNRVRNTAKRMRMSFRAFREDPELPD